MPGITEKEIDTLSEKIDQLILDMASLKSDNKNADRARESLRNDFHIMNATLAQNTASLQLHIRRTELLEDTVKDFKSRLNELEVKKIEFDAVKRWKKDAIILSGKIIGIAVGIVGLAAALPHFLQWLNH